jgi:hypothetical protein
MEWKRPLLIGLGWGIGTALGLAALGGIVFWYTSRPKPPKPWNSAAIVSTGSPGFNSTSDYKHLELTYSMENRTRTDYQIASEAEVKVMLRTKEGTLSTPLSTEAQHLWLPVFIPAKQKAFLTVSLALGGMPEHNASETDEQYHERLRAYCEKYLAGVGNIVLFDEGNRYQIELPRWLAERPKESP